MQLGIEQKRDVESPQRPRPPGRPVVEGRAGARRRLWRAENRQREGRKRKGSRRWIGKGKRDREEDKGGGY